MTATPLSVAALKRSIKRSMDIVASIAAKRHLVLRSGALHGAYPDRNAALAAVPVRSLSGYDHDAVVDISRDWMSHLREWDYPLLFWLDRLIRDMGDRRLQVLDAGGHVGTKFLAFGTHLNLSAVDWQVFDLPSMVAAGRALADREGWQGISFEDDISAVAPPDVLLCSGLLQYLDRPFSAFVASLPARPRVILLNKVSLRDGPAVFTLEHIGPAHVPYQIRNRQAFIDELASLGYLCHDVWEVAALARRICSHPELGFSESRGFMLVDADHGHL